MLLPTILVLCPLSLLVAYLHRSAVAVAKAAVLEHASAPVIMGAFAALRRVFKFYKVVALVGLASQVLLLVGAMLRRQ